jgi:hypothetical protein
MGPTPKAPRPDASRSPAERPKLGRRGKGSADSSSLEEVMRADMSLPGDTAEVAHLVSIEAMAHDYLRSDALPYNKALGLRSR